jgi:GT2 family glycosyltransferase
MARARSRRARPLDGVTQDPVEASVVIPTIGRPSLLRMCLDSLALCDPRPGEVLVVDQGTDSATAAVLNRLASLSVTHLRCDGSGRGRAVNAGLTAAANEIVLVTDDDCTVASDWVGLGFRRISDRPDTILTGRVLPTGNADSVPARNDDEVDREYRGKAKWGTLFGGNMVCHRSPLLALGGFDERIMPAAEDDELSYRWLDAGGGIRHDPDLVVWHLAWRTREELEEAYVRYAIGLGVFYAKYLRRGDLTMLRAVGRDLYEALRSLVGAALHARARWNDPRRATLRGLPIGLARGWRAFR